MYAGNDLGPQINGMMVWSLLFTCQPGTVFASFIADSKFLVGIVAPCELSVNVPLMIWPVFCSFTAIGSVFVVLGVLSTERFPLLCGWLTFVVSWLFSLLTTSLVVTFSLWFVLFSVLLITLFTVPSSRSRLIE